VSSTHTPDAPDRPQLPHVPLPGGTPRRGAKARLLLERALDRLPFLEKEMPVVAGLVQPGWTCIDIGAAGGTYTHLLSRRSGPTGRIHAVEPRARSMRYLRRFRAWLRWRNVELHQLALADGQGQATMSVPRFVHTEAHLDDGVATAGRSRSETVTTTTLDHLVRTAGLTVVDLVKCDVEGAELQVLAGAEDTLARFRPIVVCEIEARHLARYGHRPADVLAWFTARGYRGHRVVAGRLLAVTAISPDENDYVLLPVERLPS
jgi:FkbM family methyltransferase